MFADRALRSSFEEALDGFSSRDLDEAPDEELVEGYARLHRAAQALEAERLRWLGALQRRKVHRRDGYLSVKTWLADRFQVSAGEAAGDAKVATALQEMPEVSTAFSSGEVSSSAVRVLVGVREAHPEAFASQEEALVEAATARSVPELRRVVKAWSEAVDAERGQEPAERLRQRRRLDLCPTEDGMVAVRAELDPEIGEAVITAVGAICDAEVHGGRAGLRSPGQLRADALGEMARRYLDCPDRPTVGGERPHITLTVDLATLWPGRTTVMSPEARGPSFDHAGIAHAETALRLACDASIRRVVVGPASEPLDVGRRTQVVPAGLRRAVVVRDRGCRFPGCDRPPGWADAHHIAHWARGGHTTLHNLVLLCRGHHRMVHEGGFRVRMVDGRPVFSRADGSVLADLDEPSTDRDSRRSGHASSRIGTGQTATQTDGPDQADDRTLQRRFGQAAG